MERTLNITEQDLRSTLDDFLEVKEEKKPESIWNIATVTGIGLVMTATAYIGNLIGSAFFGFNTPAFFSALTTIAPIAGGTLLLFMLLTAFVKNRKKQKISEKEMEAIRQTYDKLDEFLYEKDEKRSRRRAKNHPYQTAKVHKLMKSRTDKRISGVCGGLAKYLGINSNLVRILFVTGAFLGSGLLIFLYIAMNFIMPKEPVAEMDDFNFIRTQ